MKGIPCLRPAAVLFGSVLLAVQVGALDLDLQKVGGDLNIGGISIQRMIVAADARVYANGHILDVTQPANPRLLGKYSGMALAATGDHLFTIANEVEGLQVLDVSNPATPVLVGSFRDGSGPESGGLSVSGAYAYFVEPIVGLHVLDISVPASPRQVGLYPIATRAMDIVVSGKFAYVANEGIWEGTTNLVGSGLLVIDISDPANPRLSGSYEARGSCFRVAATAGYAFVTETYGPSTAGGLSVIDVRDPSHPLRVSSFDSDYTRAVAVSGNLIYLTAHGGLLVLDATDPVEPKLAGGVDQFSEYSGDVAIVRDHVYASVFLYGLYIFRPQPANPQRLGEMGASGRVGDTKRNRAAVSGNYAYLADFDVGLQVIDIHDLANPLVIGRYSGSGSLLDVAVSGNYACVAGDTAGFEVVNVGDPSNPRRVGRLNTIGQAIGVAVAGDFAYVVTWDRGLVAVDISDPSNPRPIGRYNTGSNAQAITVSGNYAYVADYDAGLQVIDISNPALLRRAGGYQSLGNVYGVAVSGNYAFLAEETRGDTTNWTNWFGGGLVILDIADPSSPKPIGRYGNSSPYYTFISSVAVAGSYAYVTGTAGFEVIDIKDPADLRRVGGNFVLNGGDGQVFVKDDHLFFAGNGELVIFDLFRPFRLEANPGDNASQRRLKVEGPRGLTLRLQRSANIVRWENWQAITLSGDLAEITDQDVPTTPNRFYRAVSP